MLRGISPSRGFTLIEILCVVVILGIASAIIIPQLGQRDDIRVASAARMLVSDLIYAQNLAISKQRQHYIQFVDQQYTILEGDPLVAITHPINKDPYAVTLGSAQGGLAGVTIDSWDFGGPSILGFDDLGTPFSYDGVSTTTLTTPATITVRSGSQTLTISLEPFTGEANVQ